MPNFLPKNLTVSPTVPDLAQVFGIESDSTKRTVKFISHYYEKESDKTFEQRTQKNIICEEFYLLMPTRQAWVDELALCEAIERHERKVINDDEIKAVLADYVASHTFLYLNGERDVKRGVCEDWTADVPLYYLFADSHHFGAANPVQAWLLKLLETEKQIRMVRL